MHPSAFVHRTKKEASKMTRKPAGFGVCKKEGNLSPVIQAKEKPTNADFSTLLGFVVIQAQSFQVVWKSGRTLRGSHVELR